MGGTVIETESERLRREGRVEGMLQMIVEMGQECDLDAADILKRIQDVMIISGMVEKQDHTHISNGNKNAERLLNIMKGSEFEIVSEKIRKEGREQGIAQEIIEIGQEYGLDDADILKKIQDETSLSLEQATAYLEQYGKQPV